MCGHCGCRSVCHDTDTRLSIGRTVCADIVVAGAGAAARTQFELFWDCTICRCEDPVWALVDVVNLREHWYKIGIAADLMGVSLLVHKYWYGQQRRRCTYDEPICIAVTTQKSDAIVTPKSVLL